MKYFYCMLFFFLIFYSSIVLLNSAASTEQIDPNLKRESNIRKGISGEWIKIIQKPGKYNTQQPTSYTHHLL